MTRKVTTPQVFPESFLRRMSKKDRECVSYQNALESQPIGRSVFLSLPYPPTVNRYLGVTRTGMRFKMKEGKDYCAIVASICRAKKIVPFQGDVIFEMHLYRPRKIGDIQNYSKVLCDSLEGWAYLNDGQIRQFNATRHDDSKDPRVEVMIRSWGV